MTLNDLVEGANTDLGMATSDPDTAVGVLVGVDGSSASIDALRWAAFLARSMALPLTAMIAWEPVGMPGWGAVGWMAFPSVRDPARDAEAALDDAITAAFSSAPPPGIRTIVREGNPARMLLETSAGATMLVVGTRGHGGLSGLLLGSVSAACAEHAVVPVLVVHGIVSPPPVAHERSVNP